MNIENEQVILGTQVVQYGTSHKIEDTGWMDPSVNAQ